MSVKTAFRKLRRDHTLVDIAKRVGLAHPTVNGWVQRNEMPCTDYNGKTFYSLDLEEMSGGKVTVDELLGFEPHPIAWERRKRGNAKREERGLAPV